MSTTQNKKPTPKHLAVRRFGYLLSAIFLILTNIGLVAGWSLMPLFFLITMYCLTASLWFPMMIKPLYELFGKYIVKPTDTDKKDFFDPN